MKLEIEARVRRANGFLLEVSFAGEAMALGVVGPSGSGKSTLLDVIAGIEPGRVILDGKDLTPLPLHARGMGYVTQDGLLFPHLSVRDNLGYSPKAGPCGEVAEVLGITPLLDRMPRTLSGGERRRVSLGRALLSQPCLLLLDEPFSGLDQPRRKEAMAYLTAVRRRFSLPMLLVSHLAEEVSALTDRTLRLEAGRMLGSGPA